MLTEREIEQFHRDGYILVPNVLSAEQIAQLRAFLRPRFDLPSAKHFPGDTDHFLFDVFNRYPEMRWLLFHEPSMQIIKSLLGEDYAVLREAVAQCNQYGTWHKDTTSQEMLGHVFQRESDYLMLEVAYYLQDNTDELAGGLDVEPGSHLHPDPFLGRRWKLHNALGQSVLSTAWQRVTGRSSEFITDFVSIPSKAGDMVIFDFRINHRASQPRNLSAANDSGKLAVFLACSRNNEHVKTYHDFISSRPEYVYLKDFSYDPELLKQAEGAGINLV
jgi:hypothetical protein